MDDVTMFEKCGILQKVDEGDSFLVDKGFTIHAKPTVAKRRNTYICSLHFTDPNGPTTLHPDPVKVTKEVESHRESVES